MAFVAFNYAPVGWLECKGQTLPISQYLALFSLLGTTYGGNGTSTFALPNMQGRVIIGDGQGVGLTSRVLGERGGTESVTLTQNEMPTHTHTTVMNGTTAEGNTNLPTNAIPANTKVLDKEYYNASLAEPGSPAAVIVPMTPSVVSISGGNQAHPNMQPYLTLKCIIAVQGVWPTRP
ncbi:MAG: tail fiber protein [Weeksellaceae bacterium]|nr:tail fiber protein [Weeksellaceae bacterium]